MLWHQSIQAFLIFLFGPTFFRRAVHTSYSEFCNLSEHRSPSTQRHDKHHRSRFMGVLWPRPIHLHDPLVTLRRYACPFSIFVKKRSWWCPHGIWSQASERENPREPLHSGQHSARSPPFSGQPHSTRQNRPTHQAPAPEPTLFSEIWV